MRGKAREEGPPHGVRNACGLAPGPEGKGGKEQQPRDQRHTQAKPRGAIQPMAPQPHRDRKAGMSAPRVQNWPLSGGLCPHGAHLPQGLPARGRPSLWTQVSNQNTPSSFKGSSFSWTSEHVDVLGAQREKHTMAQPVQVFSFWMITEQCC